MWAVLSVAVCGTHPSDELLGGLVFKKKGHAISYQSVVPRTQRTHTGYGPARCGRASAGR